MDKRAPERTCIGCGRKARKDELLRIVLTGDEAADDFVRLVPDSIGRMKGRGAYLCRKRECLELAVKRKAFNRAFRQAVSQEMLEGLKSSFDEEVK